MADLIRSRKRMKKNLIDEIKGKVMKNVVERNDESLIITFTDNTTLEISLTCPDDYRALYSLILRDKDERIIWYK